MRRIEICSPIPGKGLDRDYIAQDPTIDESGYVELGATIFNDDDSENNTSEMLVTATDETQNKKMEGTGNVYPVIQPDGQRKNVTYYPFHYEFHTAGEHTITFAANDLEASVTLTAKEPNA